MTVDEMVYEFYKLYDIAYPQSRIEQKPTTSDIVDFLNIYQIRLFNGRYLSSDIDTNIQNAFKLQHELSSLSEIVDTAMSSLTYDNNEYIGTLNSTTYAFPIRLTLKEITRTTILPNTTASEYVGKHVPSSMFYNYKSTPNYDKKILTSPVWTVNNNFKYSVIVDSYTVTTNGTASTLMLRYPRPLIASTITNSLAVTTSDLDASLHEQLVNSAYTGYMNEYKFSLKVEKQKDK